MSLLKLCSYPGCRKLVPIGQKYCDQHKDTVQVQRPRYDRYRESAAARGYGHCWRKLRAAFHREHPLCEECRTKGILTPAMDVDHIIPHKGNQQLMWDKNNLQALCKSCHSRKTAREDGGFGNSKKSL